MTDDIMSFVLLIAGALTSVFLCRFRFFLGQLTNPTPILVKWRGPTYDHSGPSQLHHCKTESK